MKIKNWKLYLIIAIVVCIGALLVYRLAFVEGKNDTVKNITIQELEKKINNKETFMLVLTQTGCSHCEQYLPELSRTLSLHNLVAYELNITNLDDEGKKTLSQYANFSGTPTTIFFTDGVEKTTLNRIIGYASQSKIEERLKSLGYIK